MKFDRADWKQTPTTIIGIACLATIAGAQSLVITNGQVLATHGSQVPGMPAGVIFGGTSAFDNGVIDEMGNVCFRGRMQDPGAVAVPPITPLNERAYFHGYNPSSMALAIRSGDPAPGLPGLTLNSGAATATGNGLPGGLRLSPNGQLFHGAGIAGAGVVSATASGIFAGPIGAEVLLHRQGDFAPTGGATLTTSFSGMSQQSVGMNRTGRFVFKSSLAGGDVTPTFTNNDGVFTGSLGGSLEWVVRKGDVLGTGEVISATGGFLQQINDSGQILHDVTLSTTLGSVPATALTDKILYIYTPGVGNTQIVRESDPAPGTVGATFNTSGTSWFINVPPNAFTGNGQFMMHADLFNGDVTPLVNDRAIYIGSTSGMTLALRKGDPAPGTDGTFATWNNTNSGMTTSGRITIQSSIIGGTTTLADNSGIWTGLPGSLQLIVREGDILPGTAGVQMIGTSSSTDNGFGSSFNMTNDAGLVYFHTDLIGGDVVPGTNDLAWCVWDPALGLRVVARRGDLVEALPTVFKPISTVGSVQFNNCDNTPLSFAANGLMVVNTNFLDGSIAVVKISIPTTPGGPFCSGDGSAATCPCGNFGLAGRGCGSSINANGARLVASGSASLSADTLLLSGSDMPNSSALYIQGSTLNVGGLGAPFGDGLRCAGGTIVRLKTVVNVAGASSYPEMGDASVSVRGLVTAPGLRSYQVWYRNSAAFCTPDTFNLSNGWQINWTL